MSFYHAQFSSSFSRFSMLPYVEGAKAGMPKNIARGATSTRTNTIQKNTQLSNRAAFFHSPLMISVWFISCRRSVTVRISCNWRESSISRLVLRASDHWRVIGARFGMSGGGWGGRRSSGGHEGLFMGGYDGGWKTYTEMHWGYITQTADSSTVSSIPRRANNKKHLTSALLTLYEGDAPVTGNASQYLFTKPTDVLPQYHVRSRSRKIGQRLFNRS